MTSRGELSKIISKPHKNLVHLQEIFYDEGQIFFVYELLDVSLAQIFGSPLGRLQLFEVAAFSKEILAGVQFIHGALNISHGKLNSSNVLLSVNGAVKIGASMLGSRDASDSQNDIAAIGNMIVECLDPKAFLQGGSLSEQWPSNVSSFAKSTKVKSAKELSKFCLNNKFASMTFYSFLRGRLA
ncbi:hypothetical protein N7540_012515 [Penicillium herquei]|nr:hypothetical protein N7540_012515 [Penicillium herquei]